MFHDVFEVVKTYFPNGELVDLHDNYNDISCYLSSNGVSGFAIESNGNLVSVFNLDSKKGFLRAISNEIKTKAKMLDYYVSPKQDLQGMYQVKFGFKTASIMDYNMEYDLDNIAANHNEPQVAFIVNTSEEVETRHFNKDQYDEAQEYQLSFVSKDKVKYSKDLDKIQDNIVKEYENIKIGKNGKILRYEITEPLFEIVNDSIASKLGLQNNDKIISIIINNNEFAINRSFNIHDILLTIREDDSLQIKYLRNSEESTTSTYVVASDDISIVD